ncbi:MAG: hypothetical protein ACI86M_003061 [Saprospiraceae bacterium]|jgi:hypothetical protein
MSTKILRRMARLDELGLRHKQHNRFMKLFQSYNYKKVFIDSKMIKAWGHN